MSRRRGAPLEVQEAERARLFEDLAKRANRKFEVPQPVVIAAVDPSASGPHGLAIMQWVGWQCSDQPRRDHILSLAPLHLGTGKGLDGLSAEGELVLDLVLVEGQEMRGGGRTPNAQSLLDLAYAAGKVEGWFRRSGLTDAHTTYLAGPDLRPSTWKGSVPKKVHQARLFDRLGWPFVTRGPDDRGYCVPKAPEPWGAIKPAHWKEVADALALAVWGWDRLQETAGRLARGWSK